MLSIMYKKYTEILAFWDWIRFVLALLYPLPHPLYNSFLSKKLSLSHCRTFRTRGNLDFRVAIHYT